MRRNLDKAKNS